jgi:predicted alpha/beta-fold hydrolase
MRFVFRSNFQWKRIGKMPSLSKVAIIIGIIGIIYIFLNKAKTSMLYHPEKANDAIYREFYEDLKTSFGSENVVKMQVPKLTETPNPIYTLDSVLVKHPTNPRRRCMILCHGNAGNLASTFETIKFLRTYADVIAFDYRSYGRSSGNKSDLSSEALLEDANLILSYALDKGYKLENIALVGVSLGCAVATALAADIYEKKKRGPYALILNAPFYSLKSMMEVFAGKFGIGTIGKLVGSLIGNEYQTDELIKKIDSRTTIFIAHSPKDEVIPYTQSQNLYTQVKSIHPNTKMFKLEGLHNDIRPENDYMCALSEIFH